MEGKPNSEDIAFPSTKSANCTELKTTINGWLSYGISKNRVQVLFKHIMLYSRGGKYLGMLDEVIIYL